MVPSMYSSASSTQPGMQEVSPSTFIESLVSFNSANKNAYPSLAIQVKNVTNDLKFLKHIIESKGSVCIASQIYEDLRHQS